MLPSGTILQDRYSVIRELGHGGMGTVYEAIDQRVNSIVALKETLATHGEEAREAFGREAALLANLRHQALPKVMDYFSESDSDFLVMEFIPGYDLADLLHLRGSPFPQAQVLRWADDLLRVLEYLHGYKPPILHRDIKPSNLKLTKHGEMFLLDFGLAKGSVGQMPTLQTSRSVRGYTPVYASLEQITGHGTDARSDLYSLGATLYHLLSGFPPVDTPTRFHAVEDDEPDPLQPIASLNPQASQNVSEAIEKAMAISRKHRPISAAEMRKALRSAAEEDERRSAQEEYDRAEQQRHKREDERRRVDEEETLHNEAHVLERSDLFARRTPDIEGESVGREKVVPDLLKATIPAPTIPSRSSHTPKNRWAPSQRAMASPPPESLATLNLSRDTVNPGAEKRKLGRGSWRKRLLAAVALVIVGGMFFVLWLTNPSVRWFTSPSVRPIGGVDKAAIDLPKAMKNQLGIDFVLIPPGTFMMGSTIGDDDEKPMHQVTIKYSFYIGKYEVTQAQWKALMGTNPSDFKGENNPVEKVSLKEVQEFLRLLNLKSDGYQYRLPTEAEWEYACRAESLGPYAGDLEAMAWYSTNSEGKSHPVGQKLPNTFGLYDMHGNLLEWCQDWYHPSYKGAPTDGSAWRDEDATASYLVLRGGSWILADIEARSANRYPLWGEYGYNFVGFRIVATGRKQ